MASTVRTIRATLTSALVVVALGVPGLSRAQAPVTAFDQLSTRLKPNDTIRITDDTGKHTGRFAKLTPDTLTLSVDGEPLTWLVSHVRQVDLVGPPHKLVGALIGFGSGAAIGLVVGTYAKPSFLFSQEDLQHLFALFFGGIGTGIGALAGCELRGKGLVVYQAPSSSSGASLMIVPVISPQTRGISFAIRF